jgi:hypothetical protein
VGGKGGVTIEPFHTIGQRLRKEDKMNKNYWSRVDATLDILGNYIDDSLDR